MGLPRGVPKPTKKVVGRATAGSQGHMLLGVQSTSVGFPLPLAGVRIMSVVPPEQNCQKNIWHTSGPPGWQQEWEGQWECSGVMTVVVIGGAGVKGEGGVEAWHVPASPSSRHTRACTWKSVTSGGLGPEGGMPRGPWRMPPQAHPAAQGSRPFRSGQGCAWHPGRGPPGSMGGPGLGRG